jgi:hypothetical protein
MTSEPKFGRCKDCAAWGREGQGSEEWRLCVRHPNFTWKSFEEGCFSFIEKEEIEK